MGNKKIPREFLLIHNVLSPISYTTAFWIRPTCVLSGEKNLFKFLEEIV